MDNNMNNDFNQAVPNVQQPVNPMGIVPDQVQQPINPMGPVPDQVQQPVNPMGPVPEQVQQPINPMGPVPNQVQQPVNPMGPVPDQVQQSMNSGDIPVINVEQTPTEVFGQQVNAAQPNDPTRMNQMLDSINMQQQPEQPKYGYATNEQKPDLNADSNINLKFVIVLAIFIFAFIMALPYLSSLLDK